MLKVLTWMGLGLAALVASLTFWAAVWAAYFLFLACGLE